MSTTTSSGFAILRANGEALWFDAITRLRESHSASVSKHPLADGSFVADHSTYNNPQWSLSGILSDADFNLSRPTISNAEIEAKQFTNSTTTATRVFIDDSNSSAINKILPEVIAQFTTDQIPTVFVTPQEKAKAASAVADNLRTMIRTRELFTFFEYEGGVLVRVSKNCIFTGVEFSEDATTGAGIFPELSFEHVSFATPKSITVSVKNKGRQVGKTSTKAGTNDVATAPSSYNQQSVLNRAATQ